MVLGDDCASFAAGTPRVEHHSIVHQDGLLLNHPAQVAFVSEIIQPFHDCISIVLTFRSSFPQSFYLGIRTRSRSRMEFEPAARQKGIGDNLTDAGVRLSSLLGCLQEVRSLENMRAQ